MKLYIYIYNNPYLSLDKFYFLNFWNTLNQIIVFIILMKFFNDIKWTFDEKELEDKY